MNWDSIKSILKLSIPLIISQLGLFFVQLSDTVMVGQIGSRDLAAISFGGNVYFFYLYIWNWHRKCRRYPWWCFHHYSPWGSAICDAVGRKCRRSQHRCNTSSMCAAQTCYSLSCSHNRSRMTCSHEPFQADRRGCKNR